MHISDFFRHRIPSHFLLLLSVLFLIAPETVTASQSNILISEVSVSGNKSADEYIELYNPNDTPIDIAGLQLRRRTQSGSESSIKVFGKNSVIPAHGYFLWANSQGLYTLPFADAETSSSALADDNSIALFTSSGVSGALIDSIAWGKGSLFSPDTPVFPNPEKKYGLTRDLTTLTRETTAKLTPTNSRGAVWVFSVPDPDPIPLPSPLPIPPSVIRFNEVLANPIGNEEEQEFIELYNQGSDVTDIGNFILRDASKTGAYIFPAKTLLSGHDYLVVKRSLSKLSLNNSNESLSLFDASETLIDTVTYQKTKEGVSLNYTESGWRGGTPTPGSANQVNALPETKEKVPKKGYRGVLISFTASGNDSDGDHLKYTWDFGDGHKSYKATATHRYEKNGTYTVTLTTSDGSDDLHETFSINIESFPEKKIRITSLVPNPSGRDSEGEYLIIKNREKKPVNLKGFSIATGWKKLINHPIRENFIIAPKSEARLTRTFSLFTLPNKKGRIELRAPDGKTLQKMKYRLSEGVADDMVYKKEKGQRWQWQEPIKATPDQNTLPSETEEEGGEEDSITPPIPDELPQTIPEDTSISLPEKPSPFLPLLNYGTNIVLPETVTLSFNDSEREMVLLPQKEHYAFTFAKTLASKINTTLNKWQNRE